MEFLRVLCLVAAVFEVCLFDTSFGKRGNKLTGQGSLRPSRKTRGDMFGSGSDSSGITRFDSDDIDEQGDCNRNKLLIVFDNECVSSQAEVQTILYDIEDKFTCLLEDLTKPNVVYYNKKQNQYHAYLKISDDNDYVSYTNYNDSSAEIGEEIDHMDCLDEDVIDYEEYCIEYVSYEPELKVESVLSCTDDISYSGSNYLWNLDAFDGSTSGDNVFSYLSSDSSLNLDIYVLDTGVLSTHDEFSLLSEVIHMDSSWDDSSITNVHGTHVAGTIIGKSVGIARGLGSNPNLDVKLYEYGVCRDGGFCETQDILDGFAAVINQLQSNPSRRGVINLSFGATLEADDWFWDATSPYFEDIVSYGGITVAAAGNDAVDACNAWPGADVNVISVGSSQSDGHVSYFSNFGTCVDIYAPGSSIYSSVSTGPSDYNYLSGTSMASPYIAGVAAQMIAANADISSEGILEVFQLEENSFSLESCAASSTDCRQVVMHNCDELIHLSNGYRLNDDISCSTHWSENKSGTADDDTTFVSCPEGTIMTGCAGKTNWKYFDGSYISDDKCFARNGNGGNGVWAVARCCNIDATCSDVKSEISGSNDDDIAVASCASEEDTILTGCTMDTKWYRMDGAFTGTRYIKDALTDTKNECIAQNGVYGNGIWANARCCEPASDKRLVCRAIYGEQSETSDDATSRISCPNDYFLSGCSAYTFWKQLDGAYFTIETDECVAQNGAGGSGVWAVAVCCKEYEMSSENADFWW